MILFLLCAPGMLFLFLERPDDDTLGNLTLVYDFNERIYTSESGWTHENRIDTLTYVASPNIMNILLRTQYYCGYPLAVDVSSWWVSKEVTIGLIPATVVSEDSQVAGYDCWECEINNQSYAFYDMLSGIFVHQEWASEEADRIITLEEVIFEEPDARIRTEGVLLSGIFVELAVIVWLLADRKKRLK
jgi:hypothetical protein